MKIRHLHGLWLRHLYPLRRDFDILSDMLYWPLIDTMLWGITSQWLSQTGNATYTVGAILSALILWNVLWRSQSEVGRNLIDEIWNGNLMNLFSSPITLFEWITGVLMLSFLKTFITLSVLVPAIYFLYKVNIFHVGWWLIFFFLNATFTGWWLGFLSSSIVVRYGPKMQNVVWTLPGILLPFSAVYFPLSQLPAVIQPISKAIPTTYIFESLRSILFTGKVDASFIVISFALNALYLTISIFIFVRSFEKSRELGLARFH